MNEKMKSHAGYINSLRFLNESTDDVFFIYSPEEGKLYFTYNIERKYHLPPMRDDNTYAVSDLFPHLAKNGEKAYLLDSEYSVDTLDEGSIRLCFNGPLCRGEDGSFLPCIGKISTQARDFSVDLLTGLFNLSRLKADLIARIDEHRSGFIIVLGIDNFKHINTKYGMESGDHVLKTAASALDRIAKEFGMTAYRMDSDKFCIHSNGRDCTGSEPEIIYNKVRDELAEVCSFSSGVAEYSAEGGERADRVLLNAESAMYHAKIAEKGTQVVFSANIIEKQLDTIDLQEELRMSVLHDFSGFSLKYQPQIDCRSCEIRGVEVLCRYTSQTKGLIPTDEVVRILEETGLIGEVGAWILVQALDICRGFRKHLPDLQISVNVSYMQLREKNFAETVLDALKSSGLPGSALVLEITESMQLQNYAFFNRIFYKLKKEGIKISIDDFGTGYSNLSYLKALAIDEIKIDRSFISCIQYNAYNYRLLANIIELATGANISVCCEGVETEDEFLTIRELNPDLLQGYYFSKPLDCESFSESYINTDSKKYRQQKEQTLHNKEISVPHEEKKNRQFVQEKLSSIVDGMDEIVYVISPETHALLYLNASGREITGCYDYKGKKCYSVLNERESPCEDCPNCKNNASEYQVWEMDNRFLNRHFLIKGKQISWRGNPAKLTIALDVTEKEVTSKKLQEKLEYESNIVACTKVLAEELDRKKAVDFLLKSIGEFYDAGRAYLFELQPNKEFWTNTSEWCAEGVIPQIDVLQNVPIATTERWLELFEIQDSIMIPDIDAIKDTSPDEWATLEMQGIRSLIVSPIRKNREVIGFIGVDDPKKHTTDSGQVRTIACFLADRMIKDQTRERLNELLNLRYEDILNTTHLGLWAILISEDGRGNQMFMDKTMREIMGLENELSPAECYHHWYDRISPAYYGYVNGCVSEAIKSRRIMRLSYPWIHPHKNITTVECVVVRIEDSDGMICLAGYHREMNEIDTQNFIPGSQSIIFEINKENRSIYFHHGRGILAGANESEQDFPRCWITSGIVHPHFAEDFSGLFSDLSIYSDSNLPDEQEFLLKTTDGNYSWFRMHFRHLGTQRASAMIVMLDPAPQSRALELEHLRQKDFYHAILSETIAYAEIDMESHRAVLLGGMWESYADKNDIRTKDYLEILQKKENALIHPEDIEIYNDFLNEKTMFELIEENQTSRCVQLRHMIGGEMRWVELTGHVFCENFSNQRSALLYMKDIDSKKRLEMAREIAATRDGLTKVYNRQAFEEEIVRFFSCAEDNAAGTLLLIDMDDFKSINDNYGHIEGDKALKALADILMITFRRKDIIGRMGGDEFLVFLKELTDRETIDKRIEELSDTMGMTTKYSLRCSIGISFIHRDSFNYAESLHQADIALYYCKNHGKNTYCYFEDIE